MFHETKELNFVVLFHHQRTSFTLIDLLGTQNNQNESSVLTLPFDSILNPRLLTPNSRRAALCYSLLFFQKTNSISNSFSLSLFHLHHRTRFTTTMSASRPSIITLEDGWDNQIKRNVSKSKVSQKAVDLCHRLTDAECFAFFFFLFLLRMDLQLDSCVFHV